MSGATPETVAPEWFPDGKINPIMVSSLATVLMKIAREAGFTRETYAASIAQAAEALCGVPAEADLDPDVRRFVAERLLAASIALSGGAN